jgi:DNA-binding NtrC family response regulator
MTELYKRAKEIGLLAAMKEAEKAILDQAVKDSKNYTKAAQLLKMGRTKMVYKRKNFGMEVQEPRRERAYTSKHGGNE